MIISNTHYISVKGVLAMPKIKQSVETMVINDKGEMVEKRANKTLSWGAEPSYIKLYLQDVLYLSDMPKKYDSVLYQLLKRASYAGDKDGMQVSISAGMKRIIQKELGFKNVGSINNAITDLVKGKIMYRIDTGIYEFNPWIFGKGDWQDIARLRTEISYDDIKGRTFKTVCEYKSEEDGQLSFTNALTGTEG
jgi:hypothetical protein